ALSPWQLNMSVPAPACRALSSAAPPHPALRATFSPMGRRGSPPYRQGKPIKTYLRVRGLDRRGDIAGEQEGKQVLDLAAPACVFGERRGEQARQCEERAGDSPARWRDGLQPRRHLRPARIAQVEGPAVAVAAERVAHPCGHGERVGFRTL